MRPVVNTFQEEFSTNMHGFRHRPTCTAQEENLGSQRFDKPRKLFGDQCHFTHVWSISSIMAESNTSDIARHWAALGYTSAHL